MTAPTAVVSAVEDALSGYGLFLSDVPIGPTNLRELVEATQIFLKEG
jgi:hypothetical protein